ncbi:MAG: hypothetical protein ACOX68_01830 [Candidatus Limivicinus sp.]|jgi:hypothetical protein
MASGCGRAEETELPSGSMKSIGFSCNHMERTSCFSCSIYCRDEQVYLDAWCFADDGEGEREISYTGREISAEEMERARELAAQYGIKSYLEAYREPVFASRVQDGTEFTTSLGFENGVVLSAPTEGVWGSALKDFFTGLAIKYELN